jgi:hypothetical protein
VRKFPQSSCDAAFGRIVQCGCQARAGGDERFAYDADARLAQKIFRARDEIVGKAASAQIVSLFARDQRDAFERRELGEQDDIADARARARHEFVLRDLAQHRADDDGARQIAREKEADLRVRGFADDFIARAKNFLREPGISVVREALIAADAGWATALHDPTEGGLATGLWELAYASRVGLEIDEDAIPFAEEGRALCAAYGLDPLGVIASGSLLLTTPADKADDLINLLASANIRCAAIGRVVPREDGVTSKRGNTRRALPRFDADEITRIL